jgi:hypothetical protein
VISAIDTEKTFNKIQYHFMIKTLRILVVEGKYLNIIKNLCDKPTANIIFNGEKLKPFPLKSEMKQRCPLPHSSSK